MIYQNEIHLKVKDVCSILAIDRSTLYRWVKNGKIGKPVKEGCRCTRFPLSVIQKYQDELKARQA